MIDQQKHAVLSASSIKGTTVKNAVDETVGEIEEVMMDTQNGKVAYIVLSVNAGFLNLGSKYFAIPFGAFSFKNHQEDVVILNVDKDKLENSPGFDKDNWPTGPQREFINEVNTYYGLEENRKSSTQRIARDENIGVSHNETMRDNFEDRKNPSSKESDFLG
jgi:sporulation protein YlmC with PRC-barrel domain